LLPVLVFITSGLVQKPNKITVDEVMQKADSIPSDGTAADSEQKDEDLFVCQHSSKPDVVGSQSHGTSLEIKNLLIGFSYKDAKRILLDLLEELTKTAIITLPK